MILKDSVIGIEDNNKEVIFENFNQGDLSAKKKYMVVGLGLSIAKQFAELMNGKLWFDSKAGVGSTFYFTCEFKKSDINSNTSLKNNKIDLILIDIQMPEMNGFEATKMIRNQYDYVKPIPIIAVTAYVMREDRHKCIQVGMDDYIAKAFDIENLYNIIEFYLSK